MKFAWNLWSIKHLLRYDYSFSIDHLHINWVLIFVGLLNVLTFLFKKQFFLKIKIFIKVFIILNFFFVMKIQFWGAEKESHQQRLETAIFEDLNRYCWNQQNNSNISITNANSSSNNSSNISTSSTQPIISNGDGQVFMISVITKDDDFLLCTWFLSSSDPSLELQQDLSSSQSATWCC